MRSDLLKDATRIVVKMGTGVLTDSRKQPDLAQMGQLVGQIAEQCRGAKNSCW
jgi:glutamate 5-kinase